MKIFDIIHSESFKTFVFFITATIGVISALLTLEPLASMIIIFIAIVAYFVFFTIPSKTSNQKIRVLKKEFEKIFGRTTGLQIKAVEVIVDLMRIRPEYINDVIDFDLFIREPLQKMETIVECIVHKGVTLKRNLVRV